MRDHKWKRNNSRNRGSALCTLVLGLFVVYFLLILYTFINPRKHKEKTEIYTYHKQRQQNLRELEDLLAKTQGFSLCHGIQLNTTSMLGISPPSERMIDNENWYVHTLMNFVEDQNRYLNDLKSLSLSASKNTLINYSSTVIRKESAPGFKWTPKTILQHYYSVELPHYNLEAELELHNRLPPPHHDPIFSPHFNNPIHTTRRGYGLEGSIFVVVVSSPFRHPKNNISFLDCGHVIESIFDNAYSPSSVFVGVMDTVNENTRRCVSPSFNSESTQENLGFSFTDHVRIRRVHLKDMSSDEIETNHSTCVSPEDPIRFAALQMYRGESYVLFVREGTVLAPGWDWRVRLLYLLEHSYRRRKYASSFRPFVLTSGASSTLTIFRTAFYDVVSSITMWKATEESVSSEETPDIQRETSLRYEKWTFELLGQLLKRCSFCGLLLALPEKCLTPQMRAELTHAAIRSIQENRKGTQFTCLTRNILNSLLSFSLTNATMRQEQDSRRNCTTFLSVRTSPSAEGFHFLETAAEVLSKKETFLEKKHHNNEPKGSLPAGNLNDFLLFLTHCDRKVFEEDLKVLSKAAFEWCWLDFYKESLSNTFQSYLRSIMTGMHNENSFFNSSLRSTVSILSFPNKTEVSSLLRTFPEFWAFVQQKEVPSTSSCLTDISYIDDSFQRTNFGSQAQDLSVASLDFLFSPAETFFNLDPELELQIPMSTYNSSANTEKHFTAATSDALEPVFFDPFLPSLTEAESDLLTSAKIWTSGRDIVSLTEPLSFSVLKRRKELPDFGFSSDVSWDTSMKSARVESITRLRSIFFMESGKNENGLEDNFTKQQTSERFTKVGQRYQLGRARDLNDYLLLAGIQPMIDALLR